MASTSFKRHGADKPALSLPPTLNTHLSRSNPKPNTQNKHQVQTSALTTKTYKNHSGFAARASRLRASGRGVAAVFVVGFWFVRGVCRLVVASAPLGVPWGCERWVLLVVWAGCVAFFWFWWLTEVCTLRNADSKISGSTLSAPFLLRPALWRLLLREGLPDGLLPLAF